MSASVTARSERDGERLGGGRETIAGCQRETCVVGERTSRFRARARRDDRTGGAFFFKRAAPRRAARDDAPVSIGDDTIGVRIVMFFVSFVVRSTSVAAKLMCPGWKMTSSYV